MSRPRRVPASRAFLVSVTASGLLVGCGGSESPETDVASGPEPRAAAGPSDGPEPGRVIPPPAAAVDPGSVFGPGDGAGAAAAPEAFDGPVLVPEMTLEPGPDGLPAVRIDAAAFATACRRLDLPPPLAVDAIDPVGFAMFHAAVAAVAEERSPERLARLAFMHDATGGAPAAAILYAELVERAPDEFAFSHLLGRALAALGRFGDARTAFERSVGLRGDVPATWFRLGEIQLRLEDAEAAAASFGRYLDLLPGDALGLFAVGRLDVQSGRLAQGIERLQAAVEARADLAPAWLLLAQAKQRAGDAAGAREANERARSLEGASAVGLSDPVETEMLRLAESVGYLEAAMVANNRAGRIEEAYRLARRLAERQPTNAMVRRNLAVLAKRLGRISAAVVHAEQAVDAEPDRIRNVTTLAELYRDAGRLEEAVDTARRAVALDPGSEVPRLVLAGCLAVAGRFESALVEADAAVERAPDRPDCHATRGSILASLGRTAEAREAVGRALGLAPDHAPARALLAELDRRATEGAPGPPAPASGGDPG